MGVKVAVVWRSVVGVAEAVCVGVFVGTGVCVLVGLDVAVVLGEDVYVGVAVGSGVAPRLHATINGISSNATMKIRGVLRLLFIR
jgi:hypothetical protein